MSAQAALRSVAWATLVSGTGIIVGTVVDGIVGSRLDAYWPHQALLRSVVQFGVGVAVLGEGVAFLVPSNAASPISDGLMFYWFIWAQPRLQKNVGMITERLRHMIASAVLEHRKAAALSAATPISDAGAAPSQVVGPVPADQPRAWSARAFN